MTWTPGLDVITWMDLILWSLQSVPDIVLIFILPVHVFRFLNSSDKWKQSCARGNHQGELLVITTMPGMCFPSTPERLIMDINGLIKTISLAADDSKKSAISLIKMLKALRLPADSQCNYCCCCCILQHFFCALQRLCCWCLNPRSLIFISVPGMDNSSPGIHFCQFYNPIQREKLEITVDYTMLIKRIQAVWLC